MPSSSMQQHNGYAHGSSSRHADPPSSYSRSSREDRSHRRSPSPEPRHRSDTYRDSDRRRSIDHGRDDDHRYSSRSAYDRAYGDDHGHGHRDRVAYSPPPSDDRHSRYERDRRDETRYGHSSSKRQRSPDRSARPRSPESSYGWGHDAAERWKLERKRDEGRRIDDSRDAPRPRWSDRAYQNDAWRNERPASRYDDSHRDRESRRSGLNDDYERQHRRDDYARDSRSSGRRRATSRSRSRSQDRHRNRSREGRRDQSGDRSYAPDYDRSDRRRNDHLSSAETRAHPIKRSEAPAYTNGRSEDGAETDRRHRSEALTSDRASSDRRSLVAADAARTADMEQGEIVQKAPLTTASRDVDSVRAPRLNRPYADYRTASDPNGAAASPPRADLLPANGAAELNTPLVLTRESRDSQASSTGRSSEQAAGTVQKASRELKQDVARPPRSFGHVELPHELPLERRAKNYVATAPFKEGVKPIYKSAADKNLVDAETRDPRKAGKKSARYRDALHSATFRWDANSTGRKPLPPPRNLVLTNLSGLLRPPEILLQVYRHGRVESSELKIDPKIGQSIGIFRATFAHDFDDHGKPLESVPAGQIPQHGAKAAKAAFLALNNRVIGQTQAQAFLDRDGEVFEEKVKAKLAENEAILRRKLAPPPPPSTGVSSSPATPSTAKPNMPPPQIPRGPKALMASAPTPSYASSSPSARANPDRYEYPASSRSRTRSSYEDSWKVAAGDPYQRRRDADESNAYRGRVYDDSTTPSAPRSAPRKKSKYPSAEILGKLQEEKRPYIYIPKPTNCGIDAESIETQLSSTEPLWVSEGDKAFYVAFSTTQEANKCKRVNETLTIGAYTLQLEVRAVPSQHARGQLTRPASSVSATRPTVCAPTRAEQPSKKIDTGLRPLTAQEKQTTTWTSAELQEAVFRMLQNELAETFVRDVKSRVVGSYVNSYLKPDSEGGKMLAKATIKKAVAPSEAKDRAFASSAVQGDARLPSFRKLAGTEPKKKPLNADAIAAKAKLKKKHDAARKSKSRDVRDPSSSDDDGDDAERQVAASARHDSHTASKSSTKRRGAAAWLLEASDEEADSDDAAATSRSVSASVEPATAEQMEGASSAKGKKGSKVKVTPASKKKASAAARKGVKVEADSDADQGSEAATPETDLSTIAATKSKKIAKAPSKAKPIPADPFEAGLVEDGEDCYYLRLALDHLAQTGELAREDTVVDEIELEAEAEENAIAAGTIPKHSTGSARTEGYYRIPPEQKAMHLPDRNKATEEVDGSSNAHVLQSARNNRADSRRLVLGIEQHKRETATDTDMFKFNQLRTRKKQLKFAKSPIHDWGLYAMELIPAGDMVIEYVGEVVRQQVADEREKQYERQGNFSTYLFRVDDDLVVDATHKGNIARLMNHCCTPNCNAKILTLNGEKRIVLYAKTAIRAGEELTYDYKFQSSADDEDAIPCLCGSPGCRRFL
ncbi:histone-lysine N-methyltransferase [Pseudozyma hubeiensis SY62]|uniref:Histone-lysine N-methyltransferase, H3 lysine-4 specific n=1 Tax=Pseudozyma hubeiensis (strain SY62) TaxID=1305764 RepID=R9NXZ1_PSEHS|nr:histone-lysine N-methyltransferase [Pseudozyma hubeiensis SY62]GAC93529.1 histone-lysine N-methyltransferase [Pseudozyma hubeiensis SY62]